MCGKSSSLLYLIMFLFDALAGMNAYLHTPVIGDEGGDYDETVDDKYSVNHANTHRLTEGDEDEEKEGENGAEAETVNG